MPTCELAATDTGYQMVSMRLQPVGANWRLHSPIELCQLAESLLITLEALHAHGYVHRDIRDDNVLAVSSGWMLIDWELAAPTGTPVFWNSKASPPSISLGSSWAAQHDLWQLGHLLQKQPVKTPAMDAFAQQLMNGETTSASDALRASRATRF